MNASWTMQDLIIKAIGEMFIHAQLTDGEIGREEFIWNTGLTQKHITRALSALDRTSSDLKEAVEIDTQDIIAAILKGASTITNPQWAEDNTRLFDYLP